MSKRLIGMLLVLALVGWQGWRISRDAGVFTPVDQVAYGSCRAMNGPAGSEDLNIDAINRVAFVSALNARAAFESFESGDDSAVANGDIWLLDLADPDSQPVALNVDIGSRFFPHGIDLLHLPDGGRELYVVNHPSRDDHEIVVFTIEPDHQLTLKQIVRYPELISPNDIKAIASDRFFVTNDHGYPQSSFMARVEEYLGMSWSSVSYYDGEQGSLVIEGLKSANGIELSADQNTLFVGEALGRSIKRFSRGANLSDWTFKERMDAGTAVDNLVWGEDGRLLAGAHPKIFAFLGHAADPEALSPSHVIAVDLTSQPAAVETIYMNDGAELSGSSVAAMLDGELLIGSVFEPHFLRCKKDEN